MPKDVCVWGSVNRHNCSVWGSKRPYDATEYEHDSLKVNVWYFLTTMENTALCHFLQKLSSSYMVHHLTSLVVSF